MTQRTLPGIDTEQRSREITRRANRISRRSSKLRVLQPELVADHAFAPLPGVPRTRGDCPTARPCPYVRCRYHLWAEDAEHRAGRPGLASVPRDEHGHTLSTPGHVGDERPGMTLRPVWLKYRGLEVEREVRVYINEAGDVLGTRRGMLEHWCDRLHVGEPVLVFDDDSGELVAKATYTGDGLRLDRDLPSVSGPGGFVLTRVRGVSSCALDEIDRHGKLTNEQTGDRVGRHRTLVAREVRRALGKAVDVAEEMGMNKADLMRGLEMLGGGG